MLREYPYTASSLDVLGNPSPEGNLEGYFMKWFHNKKNFTIDGFPKDDSFIASLPPPGTSVEFRWSSPIQNVNEVFNAEAYVDCKGITNTNQGMENYWHFTL